MLDEAKLRELLAGIDPPVDRGDDFNPYEWSGGNSDDAYQMGVNDGEARLAQSIRGILGDK